MATLALPVNIIYTLGCAFVSLIVLFLNPIIISVIYNNHHLRKQPSIIYIVNLALVDSCFAAVTLTTTLFRFLHLMTIYPLCLVLHLYLPLGLITASLLLMFTNSVDRFIFIRMSLKYHSIMNSRIAKRVAIGIWTYSAAFPLLPNVICDHFWKYETCAEMTSTQTYRYLHIPLQATFFTTIVFTVLMFISVFRVVKNSRKLRHVPTRSSSMDSLSTMMSSPTLNTSTPSLPPIQELIPYEHEQSLDAVSPTEILCGDSRLRRRRLFSESGQCCISRTGEAISTNFCLTAATDDISVYACLPRASDAISVHASLPGARDASSVHASLPGARDASSVHACLPGASDAISVHASLPGARDASSVHASLPGARDAISVHASLPGARDASSVHACLPGASDAISVHASLPGARHASSVHASLPGARDAISVHASLPGARDASSVHACLPGARDAISVHAYVSGASDAISVHDSLSGASDAISVHARLQTGNMLPDLIVSQLWCDDSAENWQEDADTSATDAASESKLPHMGSDLRNKIVQRVYVTRKISVARTLSVTPDLVTDSPNVLTESADGVIESSDVFTESADRLSESRDEICSCVIRPVRADEPDPGGFVVEGAYKLDSDTSLIAKTTDKTTASDMSRTPSLVTGQPATPDFNHQHGFLPSINLNWKTSKPRRRHEHSLKWNKKSGKRQLVPTNNTFFKSQGYKIKPANSIHGYRLKMKSTLPREPLEMLNFKLEKWGSIDMITNSDLPENETCFSATVTTTHLSFRRDLTLDRRQPTNILTGTRKNMLHLSVVPSLRARRRSLSTSDNSSTVSIESSSSYSHVTTESTVTSEGTATGLQRPFNSSTSYMQATDVSRQDLRASAAQKKVISYFSDPGHDINQWRPHSLDLPQRSRLLSVRADSRLSTRRPPLLRRVSSNSHNHNNSLDSPRLPLTPSRRTYSRSVSTLTTSSTSSIPFGASSYSGRDIRTLKILFLMFCVYIMLWLPAFVIQVLRYFDYDINIELTLLAYTLGISNSVFNFFVYPMRIPKLRVSFQKLFKSAMADARRSLHRCTSVVTWR